MLLSSIYKTYNSIVSQRLLHQTMKDFQMKTSDSVNKTSVPNKDLSQSVLGKNMHRNSNFDKWILQWMKKFPKGQVPDQVSEELLYQTKSRARVKVANYMMVFAVLGCLASIISGKTAKRRGDSIAKRNEERLAAYK